MAALNGRGRALPERTATERLELATPMPVESASPHAARRQSSSRLPSRQFLGLIIPIGGMQLLAAMDGPIAVFALPKIQNELGLSDATRSWVITAYLLTFGGLMLLGGRLGDTIGRKRTFLIGVALFTVASTMSAIAWNGGVLVVARLVHGVAAAIIAPTCMALVATAFPRGPSRNAAMAVFGAIGGLGAVMGLVVGGALTDVSWRLAFGVNVPIGVFVIYLAAVALRETQKERMKLDAAGAVLGTLMCTAAVFGLSLGPEHGWVSSATIGSGVVAVAAFIAFVVVERSAENPVIPFSLFADRNRLAAFVAFFLSGGVIFTLSVLVALYVQSVMGYSPLQAGIAFIPFAIAIAIGVAASSRIVTRFRPRVVVLAGCVLMLGSMLYGSTFDREIPYFPNLVLPLIVGAIGLGMINVPLGLSLIATVDSDRIGPTSAISLMLNNLGGPMVLAGIQVVITSHALRLGGTTGPVTSMNATQLNALDQSYTYGLLWLAGVVIVLGGVAALIGYTAEQVAHAQEVNKSMSAGEP